MRVIEELSPMGSEALHCWLEHKIAQTTEDFDQEPIKTIITINTYCP
jgi:hypothetical protein